MSSEGLISKTNSLVLKGGGILLMLIHHLFYSENSRLLYDDIIIHGHGLTNEIGIFCKLCVAIFVFVSGYGLAYKYSGNFSLKDYYWSRYKKLYLNYWFIWLLFIPISILVFHRTFQYVYGTHVAIKAGLEFLGVLNLIGQLGYNPTWWFYSCIIILYLIYPWLNKHFEESPYLIISLSVFATFIAFLPFVQPYSHYVLTFIAGMLVQRKPQIFGKVGLKETLLSLVLLCLMRNFCGDIKFLVDTLICVGLAMLLYRVSLPRWLSKAMESLGKHSMNIFLFHTFIYLFWFKDYIYITRNPLLIFLSLLIPCYIISVVIEFIKNRIGFYRLIK